MIQTAHPAVQRFRKGLQRLYGDRLGTVLLFGSRARGDSAPEADFDILIGLHGEVDPGAEIERTGDLTSRLCLEQDIVINRVFVSMDRLESEQSPLLLNIRREGSPV